MNVAYKSDAIENGHCLSIT